VPDQFASFTSLFWNWEKKIHCHHNVGGSIDLETTSHRWFLLSMKIAATLLFALSFSPLMQIANCVFGRLTQQAILFPTLLSPCAQWLGIFFISAPTRIYEFTFRYPTNLVYE
jgi:hypothetical protein